MVHLKELDMSWDIVFEFFQRNRTHDRTRSIVLTGHLIVEYLINRVIKSKCKASQSILKDSRNYPFSVKLQLLYSMKLLPDHIYNNIKKLNTFRNQLAHNLDFDESRIDRSYFNRDGKLVKMRFRRTNPSAKRFLRMFSYLTVEQLARYISNELRLSRSYRKALHYRSHSDTKGRAVTIKE